jgi:hypothetical protein
MVKKDWESLISTSSTDPQTTSMEEDKKLRQLTSMDKSPPSTQLWQENSGKFSKYGNRNWIS